MRTGVDVSDPAFRERLRRLCEPAGLDAEELARRSGVSVRVVRGLLAGTRTRASRRTVDALAAALRTSGDALLHGEHTPPRARKRRRLAWLAAGLLVVAAAGLLLPGRVRSPRPVVDAPCEGRQITLRDPRTGHREWSEHLSRPLSLAVIGPWRRNDLLVYGTRPSGVDGGRLYVRPLRHPKRLLETFTMTPRGLYPADIAGTGSFGPGPTGGAVACRSTCTPDIAGDGDPEMIVCWGFDPWYPACIALYRRVPAGLEEAATYFTCGALRDVIAKDIDGDGKDEVVFLSINNAIAYQGVMVTVLDDTHWSGAAVDSLSAKTHWAGPDVAADGCLARVVFPHFAPEYMDALSLRRLDARHLDVSRAPDGDLRIGFDIDSPAWLRITLDGRLEPVACEPTPEIDRRLPPALRRKFHGGYVDRWLATRVHFGAARVDGR